MTDQAAIPLGSPRSYRGRACARRYTVLDERPVPSGYSGQASQTRWGPDAFRSAESAVSGPSAPDVGEHAGDVPRVVQSGRLVRRSGVLVLRATQNVRARSSLGSPPLLQGPCSHRGRVAAGAARGERRRRSRRPQGRDGGLAVARLLFLLHDDLLLRAAAPVRLVGRCLSPGSDGMPAPVANSRRTVLHFTRTLWGCTMEPVTTCAKAADGTRGSHAPVRSLGDQPGTKRRMRSFGARRVSRVGCAPGRKGSRGRNGASRSEGASVSRRHEPLTRYLRGLLPWSCAGLPAALHRMDEGCAI